MRYEADTPCIVGGADDCASFEQACSAKGFKNWWNVAVVSDSCDEAEDTEASLVAMFNSDCQEGGWLWRTRKNMHWKPPSKPSAAS
jgi:hypothetical protein